MPLNDVRFNTLTGGIGTLTAGEDNISALLFSIAAPVSFGSKTMKAYVSLKQIEADGILNGNATYGIVHYHAKEYFRQAPEATLWLGFNVVNIADDFMAYANGSIRQAGVFFTAFTQLSTVYQAAATALAANHSYHVQFIAGYDGATLNLAATTDMGLNNTPNVAVVISGDGGGLGKAYATSLAKAYIPCVGAVLGLCGKAKVHESIAGVKNFNLSNNYELEIIRLADGTNNPTNAVLDQLNTKKYLVLRKHVGIAGSYLNDSFLANDPDSDFNAIERNRVMGKAKRLLRKVTLPYLNSPLYVNPTTGRLSSGTILEFEGFCENALNLMLSAGEVSGFKVSVNPNQNVLQTSTLYIQVEIVPVGVGRNIVIEIGYAVKVG